MPGKSFSRHCHLSAAIGVLALALIAVPLDFVPTDGVASISAARAQEDVGARASKAKDKARERYARALDRSLNGAPLNPGKPLHIFSARQVKGLLGIGWKSAIFNGQGFKNHGERVRTLIDISKRRGYGAWVGAMQANFGTMQELGIASLKSAVADTERSVIAGKKALATAKKRRDPAAIAESYIILGDAERTLADAKAALYQTIADAKPGPGPKGPWATRNLDINADGVVDRRDLEGLGP